LTLVFSACKKAELPMISEDNAPVYYLQGELDGEAIDVEIDGVNNTIAFSSELKRGIPVYNGIMTSKEGEVKFKMEIYKEEKSKEGPFSTLVQAESKKFIVHPKAEIYFDFQGMGNQDKYMQIENTFGVFESHANLHLNEYGLYEERVRFSDYGEDEFNLVINHGFNNQVLNPYFESQGSDSIVFLSSANNKAQHEWYINDSLVGTGQFYFGFLPDGIFHIRHIVKNHLEEEESFETLIRMKGGQHFWQMRKYYTDPSIVKRDNFGKIIYSIFKDGEWYTTQYATSNLNQQVAIDSVVQYYPTNMDPYALFKFNLNAVLYNASKTDSIMVNNLHGVAGVAIK
jgi:hypothetical protein